MGGDVVTIFSKDTVALDQHHQDGLRRERFFGPVSIFGHGFGVVVDAYPRVDFRTGFTQVIEGKVRQNNEAFLEFGLPRVIGTKDPLADSFSPVLGVGVVRTGKVQVFEEDFTVFDQHVPCDVTLPIHGDGWDRGQFGDSGQCQGSPQHLEA